MTRNVKSHQESPWQRYNEESKANNLDCNCGLPELQRVDSNSALLGSSILKKIQMYHKKRRTGKTHHRRSRFFNKSMKRMKDETPKMELLGNIFVADQEMTHQIRVKRNCSKNTCPQSVMTRSTHPSLPSKNFPYMTIWRTKNQTATSVTIIILLKSSKRWGKKMWKSHPTGSSKQGWRIESIIRLSDNRGCDDLNYLGAKKTKQRRWSVEAAIATSEHFDCCSRSGGRGRTQSTCVFLLIVASRKMPRGGSF